MPYKDKVKQREYQLEWIRQRRIDWLRDNGPCVLCGSTEDLEVDHLDPALKVDHKVWSWSAERRRVELAKCRVLCAECHKIKSNRELNRPLQHGTASAYSRGCRCTVCREANRQYKRYQRGDRTIDPRRYLVVR